MAAPEPRVRPPEGASALSARARSARSGAAAAAPLVVRWALVGGCIAVPWALLAADAAPALRNPVPRWAIRGMFVAYIGAAVLGTCAYVLLWSSAGRLCRRRQVADQVRLAPGAGRWLSLEVARRLLVELIPPLLALQLLWTSVQAAVPVATVLGLHAYVLCLGLALGVARADIELLVQGSRWAVGLLAVLLAVTAASALWLPPLLPAWLDSRAYGPVLVALNPLLAAAQAAHVDLLHHGLWYGLSPLATRRFSAPPAGVCTALPLAVAMLLVVAFPQFRFRPRID